MSGQIIELIIFACVALFIINKLISVLGNTSETEQDRNKVMFKNHIDSMRDVTHTLRKKGSVFKSAFFIKQKSTLQGLVVPGHEQEVMEGVIDIESILPSFSLNIFIKGAKKAFRMIIEAKSRNDDKTLNDLIDKRYIKHFHVIASDYGTYSETTSSLLIAQVSEVYKFGNNIFVKILFAGDNITSKIKLFREEWTFTKSTLKFGPEWYLSNIDPMNKAN